MKNLILLHICFHLLSCGKLIDNALNSDNDSPNKGYVETPRITGDQVMADFKNFDIKINTDLTENIYFQGGNRIKNIDDLHETVPVCEMKVPSMYGETKQLSDYPSEQRALYGVTSSKSQRDGTNNFSFTVRFGESSDLKSNNWNNLETVFFNCFKNLAELLVHNYSTQDNSKGIYEVFTYKDFFQAFGQKITLKSKYIE